MLLSHDGARRACGRARASLIVAVAVAAVLPANAPRWAVNVAKPAAGGRIVLDVGDGRLRRAAVKMPARCENNHSGSGPRRWRWRCAAAARMSFAAGPDVQGQAANKVRCQRGGRVPTKIWAVCGSPSWTSTSAESTTRISATRARGRLPRRQASVRVFQSDLRPAAEGRRREDRPDHRRGDDGASDWSSRSLRPDQASRPTPTRCPPRTTSRRSRDAAVAPAVRAKEHPGAGLPVTGTSESSPAYSPRSWH